MKPFRNRGWKWLWYMEKILPVAGATGSHSYSAIEANPPSLASDQDPGFDHASQAPFSIHEMDVDSLSQSAQPSALTLTSTFTTTTSLENPLLQPATK